MAAKKAAWKQKLNLERLEGTNVEPRSGDIFTLKVKRRGYFFGRVIQAHVKMMSWDGVLVYIYKPELPSAEQISLLSRDQLLIAPVILEAACWGSGFAKRVCHAPLTRKDIQPVHCFWDDLDERFVDQDGKKLARKHEPYGDYGITTAIGFDKEISKAIGIPVAAL